MKNTIAILVLILSLVSCKKEKTAKTLSQLTIDSEKIHLATVNDPKGITVRNQPSINGKSIGGFGFGSNVTIISLTGKFEKIKSWSGKIVNGQWVEVNYPNKRNILDTCYVFDGFLDYKHSMTSFITINGDNDTIIKSKKIMALENELAIYKSTGKLIIENNKKAEIIVDSLQKKIEENYINKKIISLYISEGKQFFNYIKLVNNLFNKLNLETESFLYSLGSNKIIFNKYDNDFNHPYYKEKKEIPFLNYMWNNFDRSKESINIFFTDEIKSIIYSLFHNNNFYTNSGMRSYLKGLLLAYEEISTKEKILKQIYMKSQVDTDYMTKVNFINSITSDKMLKLIQSYEAPFRHSDNYRAFQFYSFWARRHHEDNKEIVFKLLKEFDENIREKKDLDKMLPEIMF